LDASPPGAGIVDADPAGDDTAWLVLRRPNRSPLFSATEAPYLARAWAVLLGDSRAIECQVVVASVDRGTACTATPSALVCTSDPGRRCGAVRGAPQVIPYERLIVASYDVGRGRCVLERHLPAEYQASRATAVYAPERLVRAAARTRLADRLLEIGAEPPPRVTSRVSACALPDPRSSRRRRRSQRRSTRPSSP
jgi:hypothetical protein